MGKIAIGGLVLGKDPVIKKVQHGSITVDGTSSTDTIDAVVTANSLLMYLGQTFTGGIGVGANKVLTRIELTNTTTVTAYRNTDNPGLDPVVQYCVVEFMPGIVKSNQTGTITVAYTSIPDEKTHTATINSVNKDKSFVSHLGFTSDSGYSTFSSARHVITNTELTDATTVTITRTGYYTDTTAGYQVIEFY